MKWKWDNAKILVKQKVLTQYEHSSVSFFPVKDFEISLKQCTKNLAAIKLEGQLPLFPLSINNPVLADQITRLCPQKKKIQNIQPLLIYRLLFY